MVIAGGGLFVGLIFWLISLYLLYWVIRLGVRHGVRDVNRQQ